MNFFISILSGIVTAFLIWLFTKVIAPQYYALLYKAAKLSGDWYFYDNEPQSEPEDSNSIVGTAEFSQFGENIRAKVTRNISRAGKPIKRVFNYEGKIRGGQILLTFNEPKSGHFITGNIVLKLSGNMKKLSGYTVYLQHDTNEIVARKIWFTRK